MAKQTGRAASHTKRQSDQSSNGLDLEYWGRFPAWRIDESAALLLSLDPDDSANESSKNYTNLRRLMQRAADVGELKEMSAPEEVIEWAVANDLPIPASLRDSIEGTTPVINWRKRALKYYAELRHLRNRMKDAGKSIDDVDDRSLNNLYRILYVMAVEQYKFNPDQNNTAVSKIMQKFDKYKDIQIVEQTVRNHINAAKTAVGHEFKMKRE